MFAWWALNRGLTLGARAVVLDGRGRVYLVKHSYVPGWHLPGGGVERGESVEQALVRELAEEAGVRPTTAPLLHGVFHNGEIFAGDHVVVFIVRDFVEIPPESTGMEIIERGFFDLAALPVETSAATHRRLAEILRGEPLASLW